MNNSLYIAATGMQAQQTQIETIANNLANISTPGFKKTRLNFAEMMVPGVATETNETAQARSVTVSAGLGTQIASQQLDFKTGNISASSRSLDVAINGAGFFEVMLEDGTKAYSRGGSLQINQDGYLATLSGHVLKPALHVPQNASDIVIAADGKVSAVFAEQRAPLEIGQLELLNFSNTEQLKPIANGLYQSSATTLESSYGKPGSAGFGQLVQAALEDANVTMVDEMVTLMMAQRAYEMNSKMAQTADELMAMVNNLRK